MDEQEKIEEICKRHIFAEKAIYMKLPNKVCGKYFV